VFCVAAMGDLRCLNRLFQRSISADRRRRLNSALFSLAWKTTGLIMLIARDNPLQLDLHHLEGPVAEGASAEAGSALSADNPVAWWRLRSPQLLPTAASERNSSPLLTL